MKSLSFKLAFLYSLSVLVVVVSVLGYVEYNNAEETDTNALTRMKVGPGFINGALPSEYENSMDDIIEAVNDSIEGLSAGEISDKFTEVIPVAETLSGDLIPGPTITETDGEISYTISLTKLGGDTGTYYSYLIDIDVSTIGTFIVTDDYFKQSINAYIDGDGMRRFYYLTIDGYEDVIVIVSFDRYFLPGSNWVYYLIADLWISIPIILACALLFGWLISRVAVAPVKRIAASAEAISEQHLDRRVEIKSKDEIGSLGKSFNNMADKLQIAFDSQKRFISDAAHNLKTPLASMKLSVTSALENHRNAEDYRQVLEFVEGRIETQEALINELLFLARADENRLKTTTEAIDLSNTASETAEIFRYLCEEKGINFIEQIEPDILIKADSKMITHLLSNLLENALKNTSSSGKVTMVISKNKWKAKIEISDTGIGIPGKYLPHLFERFYKVPSSNSDNSGFGLGLAICKSIAESYNGKISVSSEVGEGTTFTIVFPLADKIKNP